MDFQCNTDQVVVPLAVQVLRSMHLLLAPAGGYLLIQCGTVGTAGSDFPVTADQTTTNLSLSSSSGKVALVNGVTGLGCGATASPCTLPATAIIDVVSYGASNNGEGNTTVNNGTALTNTQGAVRKINGCTDTDNNNNDFDVVTAPVPRKSTSPVALCTSASPALTIAAYTAFTSTTVGATSGSQSANLTGSNLTGAPGTITVTSSLITLLGVLLLPLRTHLQH
jgi:hypothetical protein